MAIGFDYHPTTTNLTLANVHSYTHVHAHIHINTAQSMLVCAQEVKEINSHCSCKECGMTSHFQRSALHKCFFYSRLGAVCCVCLNARLSVCACVCEYIVGCVTIQSQLKNVLRVIYWNSYYLLKLNNIRELPSFHSNNTHTPSLSPKLPSFSP